MGWCDFHEQRGWANDYCLKKDDYVSSETSRNYCRYDGKGCPIKESNSSSGGCYLTTACVQYKGLSDDCDELETLRSFRDGYMHESAEGIRDVHEYYRTAPCIVAAIDSSGDACQVYEKLYSEVIVPCVRLIKADRYDEAYKKYKHMVKTLEEKFC